MAAVVRPGVRCLCDAWKSIDKKRQLSSIVCGASLALNNANTTKVNTKVTRRYSSSSPEMEVLTEEEADRLLSLLTVKVKGADEAVLDSYTQFVQRAGNVLNLDISGKVIMPTHIEKRTLLKSPHINKTHRVQFELRTHARMLQVRQLTGDTADIFLEYIQRNIPEGVSMSVEQTDLESIPMFLQRPYEI